MHQPRHSTTTRWTMAFLTGKMLLKTSERLMQKSRKSWNIKKTVTRIRLQVWILKTQSSTKEEQDAILQLHRAPVTNSTTTKLLWKLVPPVTTLTRSFTSWIKELLLKSWSRSEINSWTKALSFKGSVPKLVAVQFARWNLPVGIDKMSTKMSLRNWLDCHLNKSNDLAAQIKVRVVLPCLP